MMGMRRPKSGETHDFAALSRRSGREWKGSPPGDEVYGLQGGAFAEYGAREQAVARKPANFRSRGCGAKVLVTG